jgi:hypothetical protein
VPSQRAGNFTSVESNRYVLLAQISAAASSLPSSRSEGGNAATIAFPTSWLLEYAGRCENGDA